MKKNVILPISSDLNRGDQALVWETVRVAKNANFSGEYYMLSENIKDNQQSIKEGLKVAAPILKHPGRKFKDNNNNAYNFKILLNWGLLAIFDFIYSVLFLFKPTRMVMKKFVSKETQNTLSLFEEAESFFVKGGGFIHASGKITDPYTIYYSLYHIFLATALKKPVYVMPNSFGPFNGFGVKWMVQKALNNCKVVTVRESISKEMLNQINIDSTLSPDLGFKLEKGNKAILEVDNLKINFSDKKYVSITARPYRFPKSANPEKKYKDYINSMVKFSKWLNENGYLPVFVEQVLSETTHESDLTAIMEITSNLNENEFAIISNSSFDCRDIKNIYSEMNYTIGTRFHSVIFSLSEKIPSIAIEYGGNKGEGILKDIGLSEYGVPIEEINFEKLKEMFEKLIQNELTIKDTITNYLEIVDSERISLENSIKTERLY
ncbi:hypothetical protein FPV21_01840 [Carnobacterium sp. PL12RED10]|uniref:polysaccharide pyruvyl transferase family protein n=1 Tax=Carnobacterium sp. PL12RED10 TaxID=2592351 RepID=UPI0011EEC338|nr:polysaccharide pyruvyl transferase family protein [Carnobacterium sp. PL12RED10]KAF3302247.1 hypothetical protein FPV21_01840 [Carnobacterium sp. PL12RED10]